MYDIAKLEGLVGNEYFIDDKTELGFEMNDELRNAQPTPKAIVQLNTKTHTQPHALAITQPHALAITQPHALAITQPRS